MDLRDCPSEHRRASKLAPHRCDRDEAFEAMRYCRPDAFDVRFEARRDGLHGVVEEGVIAEALAGNGSLESKCRKLIEAAKAAGGPDNITTVLLRAK